MLFLWGTLVNKVLQHCHAKVTSCFWPVYTMLHKVFSQSALPFHFLSTCVIYCNKKRLVSCHFHTCSLFMEISTSHSLIILSPPNTLIHKRTGTFSNIPFLVREDTILGQGERCHLLLKRFAKELTFFSAMWSFPLTLQLQVLCLLPSICCFLTTITCHDSVLWQSQNP